MKKALIILLVVVMVVTSASMVFAGRPDFAGPPANGSNRAPAPGDDSIAEIALGIDGEFEELVAALAYVGLVELFLEGTDQYTVFAPTDAAFETLYEVLGVGKITELPEDLVRSVLLYHVAEGRRAANSVVPPVRPREINTLFGETFTVDSDGVIEDIFGQTVNFEDPDLINVSASNGIIHVIDTVLVPLEELPEL